MRILLIVGGIAAVAVIGGILYVTGLFTGRARPADSASVSLNSENFLSPPSQEGVGPGYWKVAENIELYYFTDGQGTPVLVLHGGPGFPPDKPWAGLSRLNDTYTFYYYHQRGSGKSTRPFDRFQSPDYNGNIEQLVGVLGIEQQVADIERIRRILGREKLILTGHSFGGFTAALYASRFPDRVEKLILFSPADLFKMPAADGGLYERIRRGLPPGKIRDEYADYLRRFFDYGNIFRQSERELALLNSEFGKFYFAVLESKGPSSPKEAIAPETTGGWLTPALFFSLGRSYDRTKELDAVRCPTLVIHAENDITMTEDNLSTYLEHIKNCTLKIIKGAGHHAFHEKPEETARIVAAFLQTGSL